MGALFAVLLPPILPGGLPLATLLLVWGTCLVLGWVLGLYHRRVASLGPRLPLYAAVMVSFTVFFHVVYQGLTLRLGGGATFLYCLGGVLTGLPAAGAGLGLARFV